MNRHSASLIANTVPPILALMAYVATAQWVLGGADPGVNGRFFMAFFGLVLSMPFAGIYYGLDGHKALRRWLESLIDE